MLYFKIAGTQVAEISQGCPSPYGPAWVNRNNWRTFHEAREVAVSASALAGELYLAIDNGDHVYPRFDVIRAPAVGDPVSYSFNGDSYPDGEIVRISASLRVVTTSTGGTYYRRGASGCWKRKGGTWSLIHGHVHRLNPEF